MEKKQLNFSAPLISDRRYYSPLCPSAEEHKRKDSLPKSLTEVGKSGSVPFIWEQIPGKSKTSTESRVQSPESFPTTPKLPPAFLSRKSVELIGVRTPHKFSGELNAFRSYHNKFSLNGTTTTTSTSTTTTDTGLSGFHHPEQRNRDFMMDRFLPAAKAMALETSSEQSEDYEEVYDEKIAISVKVKSCGFFLPWFCYKNSIRLLKNGSKSVFSSASKVGYLVKSNSWRSPSPKMVKHVPYNLKNRVGPAIKIYELQKPKLISRPMFYSGELQTTKTGSPYRNSSQRNSPSAYRNKSPKRVSPYDENRMCSGPKDNILGQQLQKKNTRTTLEETMYIDCVNIAKVSHSILNLPKAKQQVDSSSNELRRARGMSGPLPHRSNFLETSKIGENGKRNTCKELVMVGDVQGGSRSQFTPPLPKSPSESRLSRSLPSVSPRNSVSYQSLNSKLTSRKKNTNGGSACGVKWETIVKSSHLHYDHARYSEELVTRAPQRPQTRK